MSEVMAVPEVAVRLESLDFRKIKDNDESQRAALFAALFPRLMRYYRARIGNSGDAEELAGEAITRIFANLDRAPSGPAGFEAWCSRIADSLVRDAPLSETGEIGAPDWANYGQLPGRPLGGYRLCSPPPVLPRRLQLVPAVSWKELIERLPARDRNLMKRFYLDEQPVEAICRDLGLSRNTFRLLKSRATAKLVALGRRTLI